MKLRGAAPRVAALVAFLFAAASLPQARAGGPTSTECMASAEKAQRLRRDAHLQEARQLLLACARPGCPAFVQKDCAKWLAEIDEAMPSVVVHAVDGTGSDVSDVRVLADGTVVATALDGKEISLDPGSHTMRYERSGSDPVEERLVLSEGEHHRILSVRFATPLPPTPAVVPPPARAPTPAPESPARPPPASSPLWPLVLGGAGVALVGVGIYAYVSALDDHSTMASTCAPTHTCSPSSVDWAQARLYGGGAAIAVGGLVLAGGAWLLLSRSHGGGGGSASLAVRPSPGGVGLDVRAAF